MIIANTAEVLTQAGNLHGSFIYKGDGFDLKELEKQALESNNKWRDYYCDNTDGRNFDVTDDLKITYKTTDGKVRVADMTQNAFYQLCTRIDTSVGYLTKCIDNGFLELALMNFRAWADKFQGVLMIREQDGVVRGVMSDSYTPYDSARVIRTLRNTVDTNKYVLVGKYLTSDKMHLRFAEKNPLPVKKENSALFSGFTVRSSDVGLNALTMNYLLFRQVCSNGMIRKEGSGVLFKQAHVGDKIKEENIQRFNRSLLDAKALDEKSIELISHAQGRKLSESDVFRFLYDVKRDTKISKSAIEDLESRIKQYGNTHWGAINALTELSQNYTLDQRIALEEYAGKKLGKL